MTEAGVVMSSDWRRGGELQQLHEEIAAAGITYSLVVATPVLGQVRWREIQAWMAEHRFQLRAELHVRNERLGTRYRAWSLLAPSSATPLVGPFPSPLLAMGERIDDLDRGRAIPQAQVDVASFREQHATWERELSDELGARPPDVSWEEILAALAALGAKFK